MVPHPQPIEPSTPKPKKLVTLKVTPRIHDELYGFIGGLQWEQKRRVTASEAIELLLKAFKQFQQEQSTAISSLPTLNTKPLFFGPKNGIHGRGRLPQKLDNPEQEGAKK